MSQANLQDQLSQLGWAVKLDLFPDHQQRLDQIKKQVLDCDLRTYGEKSLPDQAKQDQTNKPYIVQLHKTRNVTASKDNESSSHRPHLYRLIITDGHVFHNALVLPSLRNFNFDTPPGVKILMRPKTKIANGFYLLNDQTCEVLGGTVTDLVQKWKLAKLMGKHVRTLIGEGAPPPWVPFGTRNSSGTTVDTSQRSMDVAKTQQNTEEDPEFVRQRRAAIDTLITSQVSKTQRFAQQDVMKATNVAKGFAEASRRVPVERPNSTGGSSTATAASYPSSSVKQTDMAATAAAIKANSRIPEWAKNQISDEPVDDGKKRAQPDRKQGAGRNFDDDDDDDRPGRGGRGGFGRNRRGRGRRGDDDGGAETRPSKDVTLFDFLESKSKSTSQKPAAPAKNVNQSQRVESSNSNQQLSASNSSRISSAVQKQIFEFENGDQVLARYPEDNEYYPAVILNIVYETQKCTVMFEGYDTQEIVNFDDVEPFEEGYYEEEGYPQEQYPPPSSARMNNVPAPPPSARMNNASAPPSSARMNNAPPQHQQRQQPFHQHGQSNYGHYPQQQQDYRNRPNSNRGYPQQQHQQQHQQQQQYPNQYYDNYYY